MYPEEFRDLGDKGPYYLVDGIVQYEDLKLGDGDLAYLYLMGDRFDTLWKHGLYDSVRKHRDNLPLPGIYNLVKVPKTMYRLVNICINHSATRYCSLIESYLLGYLEESPCPEKA